MMNGDFYIIENHKVNQPGVNYGCSDPTVVAISLHQKSIAVHQKGHSGWVGRGTTGYFSASTSFGTFEDIKVSGNKIKIIGFKFRLEMQSTKVKSIETVKEILLKFKRKEIEVSKS